MSKHVVVIFDPATDELQEVAGPFFSAEAAARFVATLPEPTLPESERYRYAQIAELREPGK